MDTFFSLLEEEKYRDKLTPRDMVIAIFGQSSQEKKCHCPACVKRREK